MAEVTDGKLNATLDATETGVDTAPVGGSFTASVSGTWTGSVYLERDIGATGTWTIVYTWTANEERNGEEVAANCLYRWRGVVASGSASCRLRAGPAALR